MLSLFLSEPSWSDIDDDGLAQQRKVILNELETVIWSLISSGGRSEVRLWLCNTISGLSSINPRHQREIFVRLLKSSPLKRRIAAQTLQLLFEKNPNKAGPIVAKNCYRLEHFFKGNPRRILQWFANFSGTSDLEHGNGAKALSQFAFVNRDVCWEELEWKGKHGQSPAMVATKPHYFLDLDVQRTVENFLEYVPEFWSSTEFAESLKDGEILFIDRAFFVNLFLDLMYNDNMREIWEIIDDFLIEESFSFLCHHLLIILEEKDLSVFLELIRTFLKPNMDLLPTVNPVYWFEIILSKCSGNMAIDEVLLLNAIVSQARQLLRLVREEASQEEREKMEKLVLQICGFPCDANSFSPVVKEGFKNKMFKSIKWLGLQSWAIYYRLSEELLAPESWESLFLTNGINFHKSKRYKLLRHDKLLEDSGSDWDDDSSVRRKHKRGRKRKKTRRNLDSDELFDNESLELDFDMPNSRLDLGSKLGEWFLSTDGYSTAWSSVDLPEYIANLCFSTWLKWIFAKPGEVS